MPNQLLYPNCESRVNYQGNVKVQETSDLATVRSPAGSVEGGELGKMSLKVGKWVEKGALPRIRGERLVMP